MTVSGDVASERIGFPPTLTPADVARLADAVTVAGPRQRQTSRAPFDLSPIGTVPVCTAEDVSHAIQRARVAQAAWAARALRDRVAVIRRFHDLVADHEEELLDLVQLETGKARISAFEEFIDVLQCTQFYASRARRHLRPRRRRGAIPLLTHTVEHRRPKGVVGLITPWNYPLTLVATDAIPALLAGNAVLVKPDAQTPFVALRVLALFRRAGMPADILQIVTGRGSELGPAVVDHVDYVMFTGSTRTGREVAQRAAARLIGCSAELGGKNPLIVLGDADPQRVADGVAHACFSNAGQLCIGIELVYVDAAVHDRFIASFVDRVRRIRLEAGYGWASDMGPMVNADQLEVAARHVEDAVARGATVLTGGRRRPDVGPHAFEPTVLTGVDETMAVFAEETFGPVVSIFRVAGDDEAVARANDSRYGLNASVWGPPRHARAVAERLRAGTVNINEGYAAAWASHAAPMGGVGDSGLGRRHGAEGILKYTEALTVAAQRVIPVRPRAGQSNEAYAAFVRGAVRLFDRLP